jgi:MarR family 2-MHQ and catechol resistance regulon transcriptional repressor
VTTGTSGLHEAAERTWSADEEAALRLWIALARCYSTFAKAVSSKVAEYGLTTPQFGVLEALHHLGPMSLGELADKLLVTGGNVTYVMDRLEEQALVSRWRSPDDRRVVEARLTDRGRELIEQCFPGHASFIETLVRPLEEDERDELRRLLKKLGRSVQEDLVRAEG